MIDIEIMLQNISRARNELQELVVERDSMDEEVLKKVRQLEALQEKYYFMLNQIL